MCVRVRTARRIKLWHWVANPRAKRKTRSSCVESIEEDHFPTVSQSVQGAEKKVTNSCEQFKDRPFIFLASGALMAGRERQSIKSPIARVTFLIGIPDISKCACDYDREHVLFGDQHSPPTSIKKRRGVINIPRQLK